MATSKVLQRTSPRRSYWENDINKWLQTKQSNWLQGQSKQKKFIYLFRTLKKKDILTNKLEPVPLLSRPKETREKGPLTINNQSFMVWESFYLTATLDSLRNICRK